MNQSFLVLEYVQPRPASYDPTVPIFERKEHYIPMEGDMAMESYEAFLDQGAVRCGEHVHRRTIIPPIRVQRPLACLSKPPKSFLSDAEV